jgi:hypothetical protein
MPEERIEKLKKKIAGMLEHSPFSEEPIHSINTLEWVLELRPDADAALRIAALGHDIERADEKRRVQADGCDSYAQFKESHAINSAEILSEIMEKLGFDPEFTADVARLAAHHEAGGNDREELLKNADTLSFFQVCLPLYYDRHGAARTRKRLVWGYRKLPPELRQRVKDMEYPDPELQKLVLESI